MRKTTVLTVVQKIIIDTLHKEGKTQKYFAERTGCLWSAVSKHLNGKLTGGRSVVARGGQTNGMTADLRG